MNRNLCVLDDNGIVANFWYEQCFVDIWDSKMTVPPMRFRSYVDKGSRYASRKKLTSIIKNNRQHLGCSSKTDLNYACHKFADIFHGALSWIRSSYNEETGLEVLGQQYHTTLSVWQFLRPDLKNLAVLDARRFTDDPDLELEWDRKRRQRKGKLLREFENELRTFAFQSAMQCRKPEDLELVLDHARGGMYAALEALQERKETEGYQYSERTLNALCREQESESDDDAEPGFCYTADELITEAKKLVQKYKG